MRNSRHIVLVCVVLAAVALAALPATAGTWRTRFIAWEDVVQAGAEVGAGDGYTDGWDNGGEPCLDPSEVPQLTPAARFMFYRVNGAGWNGPTGYYMYMFMSPLAPGESKTWTDLCLWTHNYTVPRGNRVDVVPYPYDDPSRPPDGYMMHLVLDDVPESAAWDGPMDFWFDMNAPEIITLPIIETDDPLSGTRMHFTVYAPPIPEPSSLAALALGLLPLGAAVLRRRRR
jgi:hypothetical protein